MNTLILRHLCMTGPKKPTALVEFVKGLNVVHGASDTGKSFILEAIDFALGSGEPLPDVPERVGYDRVLLGIEPIDGSAFTLERSLMGGQIRCFDGLHQAVPSGVTPRSLQQKANKRNENNISSFLLEKLGISGTELVKNARGHKNQLSFRQLAQLCVIDDDQMQRRGSPLESGVPQQRTFEHSVFRFLLTGIGDNAYESDAETKDERISRTAKEEVIDELLEDYRIRIAELGDDESDPLQANAQLSALLATLDREQQTLAASEATYNDLARRRREVRRGIEIAQERRQEIDELLARFALLDEQYQSDLDRLDSLREAGSLFWVLEAGPCPLCGSPQDHQMAQAPCDGNIEAVIVATDAEAAKIVKLRRELQETVEQLRREAVNFDTTHPKLERELERVVAEIEALRSPLADQRASYSELVNRKTQTQLVLSLLSNVAELEARKAAIGAAPSSTTPDVPTLEISTSVLNQFSQIVEEVLVAWNSPDRTRVHFEKQDRDLVISGKRRGSSGRGIRCLTHAAFSVGLLEFCRQHERPHPGFVILDSPLLAYREPEGTDDDLTGTDVKERFYEHLATIVNRQVIVFENVDPPSSLSQGARLMCFSKNPNSGRYGFFPRQAAGEPL